jgi:hypothetical protein
MDDFGVRASGRNGDGAKGRCDNPAQGLLAMKWQKRTAQGFSPGFALRRFDLKVSTDGATSRWDRID